MASYEDLCMCTTQGRIFSGYGWRRSFAILNYVTHFFLFLRAKFYFWSSIFIVEENGGHFFVEWEGDVVFFKFISTTGGLKLLRTFWWEIKSWMKYKSIVYVSTSRATDIIKLNARAFWLWDLRRSVCHKQHVKFKNTFMSKAPGSPLSIKNIIDKKSKNI